ncbi:hypothetical protein BDN71DRAFT_1484072 [Pleurotus eryngii]|uniref:Uncharacterized protein n=1 Tax=Pleurotus eryngii TaxID=5323 RepID=A0A9P5ZQN0_PLEER|nr:hypothetical protein BDN71DRAFT_1484072 [Pleurotus eryngii]
MSELTAGSVACPICGKVYKQKGLKKHLNTCSAKEEHHKRDNDFLAREKLRAATEILKRRTGKVYQQPQVDDIKCEYHPFSKRITEVHHFHEYGMQVKEPIDYIINNEPWRPFRTRRDFEFASLTITQSLTKKAVDSLLELTYGAIGKDPSRGVLTLQSYDEMMDIWKLAANKMPGFTKMPVSDIYKGESLTYDVWRHPVWDWVMKLVQDPQLAPHFEWDAKHLFKYNGESWVHFYDEPVTGDLWWEIQSTLPEGGKPLLLIVYADKTCLSTFGTAKGYPVVARVGNLIINLRNGDGPSGGFMIGWLPVMEEPASETHKRKWKNHKAIVYHRAMEIILQDIINHSHTGFAIICGDVKSADYEEDCIMTLTWGTGSYCPCPICLVPDTKQAIHDVAYPLRTQATMKAVYMEAMALGTVEEREDLLKKYGLRSIENVFWKIANSDPYRSTSFDCLHTFDGGLFDDHLFKQILLHVEALGRGALTKLDHQMEIFPRWSGLKHFKAITTLSFNDGAKSEDISKCILFAAHNILTRQADHAGYILLKCMRCYINLRMYAGLHVHTSETISAGREEVKCLSILLQEYQAKANPEFRKKSWNFPKNHLYVHLFNDIEQKGATPNYSTKPSEKSHSNLKTAYRRRTNFKNVAPQVSKTLSAPSQSSYINITYEINVLEASQKPVTAADNEDEAENDEDVTPPSGHYKLGSCTKPIMLGEVEENYSNDVAFERFRLRLSEFLNRELDAEKRPGYRYLHNTGDQNTKIRPGQYLTINYESIVDWREDTNLLRCNPMFQGAPRYDHVVIKTGSPTTLGTDIIARLLMMFTIMVNDITYDIALQKDTDLQLLRLRARPRKSAEFLFLSSIIRGALVIPDFSQQGDFFLVDTVDGDMFLRYCLYR